MDLADFATLIACGEAAQAHDRLLTGEQRSATHEAYHAWYDTLSPAERELWAYHERCKTRAAEELIERRAH